MILRRRKGPDASIPTSSMADIAFLLIIFFMVTSVFAATKGIEMTLPGDDAQVPEVDSRPAILVHVRSDGVAIDCAEVAVDAIASHLRPNIARTPDRPLVLYVEGDAAYRNMVEVYDAVIEAAGPGANVFVPTSRDLDDYVRIFGENPLKSACGD